MQNKKIEKNDFYVGQLVVTSKSKDAQVRTVSHIFSNSTMVELQWYEGTGHCSQGVDYSLCMTPTLEQIEYSIDINGKLVAFHDILNF